MIAVPFFLDTITLSVHSADAAVANLAGKTVTLRKFIETVGQAPICLYELSNGDYRAQVANNPLSPAVPVFIEGTPLPA
ncbi:hypothetical protein [Marinimicrobium sp. ABcell2]|uniref:hypothetical protein n=1 Tax=Marinimicrobium sp. ABcell2 TaxID=3069751 RepID=UPI0027B7D378|nr:hypothetical protein [Marinimicrobium sp. ABcell2]MDQ2077463.1 hypothetical protein [Marinimicrobium sp. ABcell2]